jgi:hypothetical protein
MKLGDKVRIKTDMNIFNLGSFPAGATGTVAWAEPNGAEGNPIFEVLLDDYFEDLYEWDNHLQVFRDDEGEVTVDSFDVL